jgi:hypothetical protein
MSKFPIAFFTFAFMHFLQKTKKQKCNPMKPGQKHSIRNAQAVPTLEESLLLNVNMLPNL